MYAFHTDISMGFDSPLCMLFIIIIMIIEPRHEKTNILVSDLVRHKPDCAATEDG